MAAYGLVQLEKLPEFNRRRQHNFQLLDDAMKAHEGKVVRPRTTDGVTTTWMRYPFLLDEAIDRTEVQQRLGERKIATRMVWTGNILRQPGFAGIAPRAGRRFPERRPHHGHGAVAAEPQQPHQRRRRLPDRIARPGVRRSDDAAANGGDVRSPSISALS